MLAKHTKHLRLADILSVGVDRMQSNFEPMRKQVEAWKVTGLPDGTAKLVITTLVLSIRSSRPIVRVIAISSHNLDKSGGAFIG